MDLAMLAPELARLIGVSPSTLVLFIALGVPLMRAISRAIPDDAVGFAGFVRRLTAVLGVEVAAKVTSGVSVKDVAKAALSTPPIDQKVDEVREP